MTLLFGVSLPWGVRLALCFALILSNRRALERSVFLRGRGAVRALEWNADGDFLLWLADASGPTPAQLGAGSFRLGRPLFALWFTTSAGIRAVLIDGGVQDPVAFRRLCRVLNRHSHAVTGIDSRGS